MRVSDVARRYAKALLALTKESGKHASTMKELIVIRDVLNNDKDIAAYFANPIISSDQKTQIVRTAFLSRGLSEEVLNFVITLAEKDRLGSFTGITEAFQQALDSEEGVTRGVVRAARPLTDEAKKDLEQKISSTLHKKIILTFQEDPKILGGLIAQVGGWTFDDSLETHLKKLNEELNRSAN